MKNKLSMALTLAVVLAMVLTSLALADNVQNDVVSVPASITLNAGVPSSYVDVQFWIQPTSNDSDPQCNFDTVSEKLIFTINTPSGVTADPASLEFTKCKVGGTTNAQTVRFSANASAVPGNISFTETVNNTGGTFNYIGAVFYINVSTPNTPPSVSVTGVTNGSSYEFGSVPAAGCDVVDAEDGNSLFAATLSAITGPLSAYGLGSQTASCSYTDGGGLTDTDSATYSIIDTTAPELTVPDDFSVEATSASGAAVSYSASATDAVDPAPVVSCLPASGSFFALGGPHEVTCTATDASGNSNSDSFNVTVVDTTAPTLVGMPSDMTVEGNTAGGANVNFTDPTATDIVDASPSVSCSPVSGSFFALGGPHAVTCKATDDSGNFSSGSFTVTVEDTTAPVLDMPADQTYEGNTAGGYSGPYTGATATDVVDASPVVVCQPPSPNFFALGDTTINCTATDDSGNSSIDSFNVTVVDTTAPTLDGIPSDMTVEGNTAGGANVSFTDPTATDIVDASPSVSCSPASGSFFALGGPHAVICTATDSSGNSSSDSFNVTIVDTTPPTITFVSRLPLANGFGWNNSDVTVNWSCSDIVGVVAASVSQTVSIEGSAQSATGTCVDTSGNTASDTQTGIKIDKTAPTITWNGGPADGGNYDFGFVPSAPTCTAADALSGPDGCNVTGYAATVGSHGMTAKAYDVAGNVYSETRSYYVWAWVVKGFYQPVDMHDVLNLVKNGSTVPLKFEIFTKLSGVEITDVAAVASLKYTQIACDLTAPQDAIEALATGGTVLRYDTIGGQFIFNWKTPAMPTRCLRLTMTTIDNQPLVAYFKLK